MTKGDKKYYAGLLTIIVVFALLGGANLDTIVHVLQPFLGFLLP